MEKHRLEAFSDAVIAVIITVMVLELKVPHGTEISALTPLWPVFFSYSLSFVYIGIYWNNHHHMLQLAESISSGVLWANLHLLFWLSLVPFTTGWMGENHFTQVPTMLYGANLFLCAAAYAILQACLIRHLGPKSTLAKAVGRDYKGYVSVALYLTGVFCAWLLSPWAGLACFVFVALMWLVPDTRIESWLIR